MEKLKIRSIGRRCLYCGAAFPISTRMLWCSCKDHGYLFLVGAYYQSKTGQSVPGERKPAGLTEKQ